MKKNISRNPLWPDWYNGKKIDEVQFGRAFLEQWPLKCVNERCTRWTAPVEDESEIKQRILENIEEYVTSGLSKKGHQHSGDHQTAGLFRPPFPSSRTASTSTTACTICRTALFKRAACSVRTACR